MAGQDPRLIAHRGFADEFPENTLTAVREAARYADGIEVDVRRCGSGELVAVHDRRVGPPWRRRPVADVPLAALMDGTATGGTGSIATIRELLDVVPDDQRLILELKSVDAVRPAADLLDTADAEVIVSSADPRTLSGLSRYRPSTPTAYVHIPSLPRRAVWPVARHVPGALDRVVDVDELLATAIDLECEELHVRHELCLRTDIVRRAQDRGMTVGAWTVRSSGTYRSLVECGVDAIFADSWRVRDGSG